MWAHPVVHVGRLYLLYGGKPVTCDVQNGLRGTATHSTGRNQRDENGFAGSIEHAQLTRPEGHVESPALCQRADMNSGAERWRMNLERSAVYCFWRWCLPRRAAAGKRNRPRSAISIPSGSELKEQVDRGKLTKEEAIVRLAEAQVRYGSEKKEGGGELPSELKAYGEELKERVAKGELTEEEAKTAWEEAAKKAKDVVKEAK